MRSFVLMKTSPNPLVRARVPAATVRAANAIFDDLGIDGGVAINMLYAKIAREKQFPAALTELSGYAYLAAEYGVTKTEADRAFVRMKREAERDRKAGRLRECKTFEDLLK